MTCFPANASFFPLFFVSLFLTNSFLSLPLSRAPPTAAPKLQLTEAQIRGFAEKTTANSNALLEALFSVGVSKDKALIMKVSLDIDTTLCSLRGVWRLTWRLCVMPAGAGLLVHHCPDRNILPRAHLRVHR